MFTTILLAILIALALLHLHQTKGRVGKLVNKFPGPSTVPILGNIHRYQIGGEKLWAITRELNNEFYPRFRIWAMGVPAVNLRHPDDAEVLLTSNKNIRKSVIYDFLHPWLGTGLLTSTGSKWQSRRKILTPAFHFNILKQFIDIFVEESERLCASLKSEGGPIVKDLLPLISKHTLNAICETAMGTSLQGRDLAFQSKYRNAVHKMGEIVIYRTVRPWFYKTWIFMLSQHGRIQKIVLKILHDFSNNIIAERKMYHDETGGRFLKDLDKDNTDSDQQNADNDVPTMTKKRLAMLDLLIAAQRKGFPIDDVDIREEVDTFVFEGHDTTAMALVFTLALLGENPECQERARAEVDTVLAENSNKLNTAVLQKLPYLERCLKEALRLYPSVPFISRHITHDLPLKDQVVPAGALCHLHIYDLHRDPNFWPDPHKFDPERFLPENCHGRHPFSYIPFSAGPRNCIGQKFAMLEMKAIVGFILHNFQLEMMGKVKHIRMSSDLVIRPSQPVRLKFIPIKKD